MERIEQEKKSAREKKRKGQSGGAAAAAPLDHASQGQARKRAKTAGQAATASGVAPGGFTVGSGQVGPVGQGGQANKRRNPPRSRKQKLTVPQSPAFATNGRVRAPRFKSTEELQLEEIAKVRLAKAGGVGKKQGGSRERPAPLVIPTGSGSGPGRGRGAKSTTAARASKALAATRSAPQTTQAMPRGSQAARSFGDGPITRSRARVVKTTKTKQVPRAAKSQGGVSKSDTDDLPLKDHDVRCSPHPDPPAGSVASLAALMGNEATANWLGLPFLKPSSK